MIVNYCFHVFGAIISNLDSVSVGDPVKIFNFEGTLD